MAASPSYRHVDNAQVQRVLEAMSGYSGWWSLHEVGWALGLDYPDDREAFTKLSSVLDWMAAHGMLYRIAGAMETKLYRL